jgi:hypothetical protein
MHALKLAAFAALTVLLPAGAGIAADAPATKISITVMDGGSADHRPLAFSCAVESQGIPVATINTMQASLTVLRQLPDIRITCSRPGFENVVFASSRPVTADINAGFTAKRAS